MDRLVVASWWTLAAVHVAPAAVLFRPDLTTTLYDVASDGATGILIIHRGALFLAMVVLSVFAALAPEVRRAATLVVGISLVGFLTVYALAGVPAGPLRTVAVVDTLALVPLALVAWSAWRNRPGPASGATAPRR